MAMISDEERREVAMYLREAAKGDGWLDEDVCHAIAFAGGFDGKPFGEVLADLIEPQERTCKIIQAYGDDSEELDHLMEEIASTPEDTVACICQSCGHEFRYERMVRPRFCPHCGARNVTEVD